MEELAEAVDEQAAIRVGLLGELEVELQLVKRGWHPVRLDTAQMASNADLLAVNKLKRVSIQVKTTNADKQSGRSEWLGFGYSTNYLRDGKSIFNSKESPLIADVVIGVSYRTGETKFIVMPVAFAEKLCAAQCDYWYKVPTKTASTKRSDTFPIYLCFTAERQVHREHHERMKRNILAFKDKWDVLSHPVEMLRDSERWPLLA